MTKKMLMMLIKCSAIIRIKNKGLIFSGFWIMKKWLNNMMVYI